MYFIFTLLKYILGVPVLSCFCYHTLYSISYFYYISVFLPLILTVFFLNILLEQNKIFLLLDCLCTSVHVFMKYSVWCMLYNVVNIKLCYYREGKYCYLTKWINYFQGALDFSIDCICFDCKFLHWGVEGYFIKKKGAELMAGSYYHHSVVYSLEREILAEMIREHGHKHFGYLPFHRLEISADSTCFPSTNTSNTAPT